LDKVLKSFREYKWIAGKKHEEKLVQFEGLTNIQATEDSLEIKQRKKDFLVLDYYK